MFAKGEYVGAFSDISIGCSFPYFAGVSSIPSRFLEAMTSNVRNRQTRI